MCLVWSLGKSTPFQRNTISFLYANVIYIDLLGYSSFQELDMTVHSYFDGQQFENKIWVGIVAG